MTSSGAWRDPHRTSLTRSVALCAVASAIGLLLAGLGLFTGRGTSTLIVPAEDVALVNQQPIARSDYLIQLRALYGDDAPKATAAQRRKVLEDMIREELFVQRGAELDLAAVDPDIRSAMVAGVEQSVAADAIANQPREATLRAYYVAHQANYASEGVIGVRDLLFPSMAQAGQAAKALKSGEDADRVLARFAGRDTGRVQGRTFYFAAKIHLGDALFAAASALTPGGVAGPFQQGDGAHVELVLNNTAPAPRDFAAARDQVASDYRKAAVDALQAKSARFLRQRANILISDDLK
jgi:parvulin-like peptidyl-prolyl isomerase